MRIALASPPFPKSIEDGMHLVAEYVQRASEEKAELICFPESYIPGLRGMEFQVEPHNPRKLIDIDLATGILAKRLNASQYD